MSPVRAALLASTVVLVSGCGPSDGPGGGDAGRTPFPGVPPATPSAATPSSSPSTSQPQEEEEMQIEITVGGQRVTATLGDSAAGRDLVAQLPVTVEMRDHGGVEKTGRLPSALSLDGQPEGADPDVGALGYFAPGQDLVLYYGDQSYFPGIVVLGRLDGDAAERIAAVAGDVAVKVTALGG